MEDAKEEMIEFLLGGKKKMTSIRLNENLTEAMDRIIAADRRISDRTALISEAVSQYLLENYPEEIRDLIEEKLLREKSELEKKLNTLKKLDQTNGFAA